MRRYTQTIIRILLVILLLDGLSGGGNMAYALSGSGTSSDPYRISSVEDWNSCQAFTNDNYDKYFILTADLTVSQMISTGAPYFAGVFDGNGHTLTFNMGPTTSSCAPFNHVVKNGTIKNLKVKGEIVVSGKYAGGIIANVDSRDNGCVKIQNCISSVTIRSTVSGDGTHGGLVALSFGKLEIKDCIFDGQLLGRNSTHCGGFVGYSADNCTLENCLFNPKDVNIGNSGSATFCRPGCSLSNCYYTQSFGETIQGESAKKMSDTDLGNAFGYGDGADKNWNLHCDTLYLKPFQRYVDVIGWESAKTPNQPTLTGKRADNNSDTNVTYTYTKFGETDGSPDAPTTKGHYTVKATVPLGTKVENSINNSWPAWESTMNFCVYDAPKPIERNYDPNNNKILSDNGSIDVGTVYYQVNGGEWTKDVPAATETGTYTIKYYIKGNSTHNDIGSEASPAGTVTSTINDKIVNGDAVTISLSPTSFIYDNTAKEPAVTVKDGDNEIPSSEYTVSYSGNTNAGTATVTVTDKPNGNYNVSGTTTFTIEKDQLKATVTAKTLTYNTREQELVTGSFSGSGPLTQCSLKYSLDGVNYTTTIPKGTEAKPYTVFYKAIGDANHAGTDAVQVEVTISAKTVTNPTVEVSPSSFTYDGTEKKPDVTIYDGNTEIASSEYTVSYSENTNAGTAKVTIADVEGGNYTVSGTGSFTILSESSTYTPPTAKTGLIYNAGEQELLTAGSTTTGEMRYSLDGKTYSTDIPKGTDAKTYTVYYKVVGDGNHKDTSPVSLTVTISEKNVSSPAITVSPSSYYYDGTAKKPSVTVKDGDTEIPSSEYSVSYSNNTNIGTATIVISDNDGGNYRVSGTANFSIIDPEKSETPMPKSDLVYNGSAQELITGGKPIDGHTMVYSLNGKTYSASIPTGTDAKTYTVYFKEVDAENKDVTAATSLKATISPKSISITVKVYDNGNNRPTLKVYDGDGNELSSDDYTVTYRNAAGKEIDSSTNVLQAGDYTVTIKPTGNYTGASATKSIRISQPISFVFTMVSDVMTICLPYDCNVPSGYHVYYFDRVNDKGFPVFKRILTKKMGAGKSYLLRYVGSSASTRASRTVDLSPSNPALVDFSTSIIIEYNDGMLFKGTFDAITSTMANGDGDYVLQADNTWILPDDEGMDVISLEPFHAYLRYEDRSTPVSVMGMVMMATTDTDEIYTTDPDHPTGLDQIELDEVAEQWFDLQGRRLDAPQRGINIIRKSDGSIRKVVRH